ncbi:CpsB/CapC family capsule biosynthesis tyrosine phosphatase [uncultured Flavobacterium sp.]|uniref:tyrosine-protein phosphatase n=1 Tax=uncultured Flavobacterium sp. TaxID=165435 RepID=UPI0025FF74DF|nr:CpsB/CapC family capsule biosynthesis tyrosine phosphatase [uncultured Flavobacterium sp.]
MFSFLKNKKTLRDLIPDNFVDIHSHILPGIDDGSKSLEDTFSLVNSLKEIGFSQFTGTPHVIKHIWENTTATIENAQKIVLDGFKESGKNINLSIAAEYMMEETFVKLFQSEKLLTLKDNYVLVEMSYLNAPIQLYDIIFELQVEGYKPVLAHPERYVFYHHNFQEYLKLKKAGCLFQLNLLSAVGYYGKNETETAQKLLDKGLIDFVGSDVHHEKHIANFDKKIMLKNSQPLIEAIKNNEFFRK